MAPLVVPPAVGLPTARPARQRSAAPVVPVVPRLPVSKKKQGPKDVKVEDVLPVPRSNENKAKRNSTQKSGNGVQDAGVSYNEIESTTETGTSSPERSKPPVARPELSIVPDSPDSREGKDDLTLQEHQLPATPSVSSSDNHPPLSDSVTEPVPPHGEVAPGTHLHTNGLTFLAQSESGISTPSSNSVQLQQAHHLPHPNPIYRPPSWTTPPPEACEQHGPPPFSWSHHQTQYPGAIPGLTDTQILQFPGSFIPPARGDMPSFIAEENLPDDTPPATSSEYRSDNVSEPNGELASHTPLFTGQRWQRSETVTRSQSRSRGASEAARATTESTDIVSPTDGPVLDLRGGRGGPHWLHTSTMIAQDALEGYPEPLSTYIPQLFDTGQFSDWVITLSSPSLTALPLTHYVHGMIIGRSPVLGNMMNAQRSQENLNYTLHFTWPTTIVSSGAFLAALKFLYTGQVVTKVGVEQISYHHCPDNSQLQRQFQLDWALSYMISGRMLGLSHVGDAGLDLLREMLDIDTAELAMQLALHLARHDDYDSDLHKSSDSRRSSAAPSVASRPDSRISSGQKYSSMRYSLNAIIDGVASRLKEVVFNFMFQNISINFQLDSKAQPTFMSSLLPITEEFRSLNDSALLASRDDLASMQFGELPPAIKTKPSPECTIISGILLTTPFEELKAFLEAAKDLDTCYVKLAKKIVDERENRRRCVLLSKSVSLEERLEKKDEWEVVGWEESIEMPWIQEQEATEEALANDIHDPIRYNWTLSRRYNGFRNPGKARRK